MDTEDRQAEIDGVNWYHEFDFGNGLKARSRVPNIAGHRTSWQFIEQQLEKVEFRDKTVLDVGCWDGRWSFFAERRGAKSVLASDDVSQNWSNGQGLRLAREFFQSQIEVNQDLSIYSLASLGRTFDIVMCLGVYYHLLDSFFAFSQIRHCCHRNSVVLLEGEIGMALPPNHLIYTLDNPSVLKFLPSDKALENLLFAAYLRVTSQIWSGPHNKARALLGRLRSRYGGEPEDLHRLRSVRGRERPSRVCAPVRSGCLRSSISRYLDHGLCYR